MPLIAPVAMEQIKIYTLIIVHVMMVIIVKEEAIIAKDVILHVKNVQMRIHVI